MEDAATNSRKNRGISRLVKAFRCSASGIATTLKHEAAFREEAIVACILIPVSFLLNIELAQHLILIASIVGVLIAELLNSAIEAVVDDISLSQRPLAKRAKDMGSAAVLLSLLNCGVCWISVLVVNWGDLVGG